MRKLGINVYIYYLYCNDSFRDIHVYQTSLKYILLMHSTYYKLSISQKPEQIYPKFETRKNQFHICKSAVLCV